MYTTVVQPVKHTITATMMALGSVTCSIIASILETQLPWLQGHTTGGFVVVQAQW
jgi:hypothetical protein